ncbi:hypothetical protein A2U01_0016803 [Trifolium medium]|uniref:DUF4283 domain-containing protein n=1 Tax=Trifolium medium TaxID=97028 RepID=A0A392N7U0_9FABA|nr:hypothetical protein [Trifolium medium]
MDNDNGFYMVEFDHATNNEKVVIGGPWLIFDHCLVVSHWSPEFASSNAKVEQVPARSAIRNLGSSLKLWDLRVAQRAIARGTIQVGRRVARSVSCRTARGAADLARGAADLIQALNPPFLKQSFILTRFSSMISSSMDLASSFFIISN